MESTACTAMERIAKTHCPTEGQSETKMGRNGAKEPKKDRIQALSKTVSISNSETLPETSETFEGDSDYRDDGEGNDIDELRKLKLDVVTNSQLHCQSSEAGA
jgi:hypothetical protein